MKKSLFRHVILKIRRRESPFYNGLYLFLKSLRCVEVPVVTPVCVFLWYERLIRLSLWHALTRVLYFTPLFKSRCTKVGKRLNLIGGIPLIMGELNIVIGEDVTLFGVSTFVGAKVFEDPTLTIGNNTFLGYQLTITVGCNVTIGNNVLVSNRVIFCSYDGHHCDPDKRHLAAPPESSRPILIEDNVWIGQNCIILKGVTIGKGSIVGAGSIVTKDIPPNSLAVGCPVRCTPLKISDTEKLLMDCGY